MLSRPIYELIAMTRNGGQTQVTWDVGPDAVFEVKLRGERRYLP